MGAAVQYKCYTSDASSSDGAPEMVDHHYGLYVGMQYGNGRVHEIYPQWDKVTVMFDRGDRGCEVQRLKLSKVIQKVKEMPAQISDLDEMD